MGAEHLLGPGAHPGAPRPCGPPAQARVCGAWAHGKIHVMYQWLTNRRPCAHIYTCMPTWNYFPLAVSCCNKAQCMPTDRKLGSGRPDRSPEVLGVQPDLADVVGDLAPGAPQAGAGVLAPAQA